MINGVRLNTPEATLGTRHPAQASSQHLSESEFQLMRLRARLESHFLIVGFTRVHTFVTWDSHELTHNLTGSHAQTGGAPVPLHSIQTLLSRDLKTAFSVQNKKTKRFMIFAAKRGLGHFFRHF